jgi:acyl carrier protein
MTPFVAPTNPIEQDLARIWAEVLSVDQIGIHDDFFALGGHSLAASRVISRVIGAFQLQLSIKALFDSPTVATMAAVIAGNLERKASEADLERLLSEIDALSPADMKELPPEPARPKKPR